MNKDTVIIALGGSTIVPDKINVDFLRLFRKFVLRYLKKGKKFVIVAGGGRLCRRYQEAGAKIVRIKKDDLDWIGIHSTRLNAHLLRTIFRKKAYKVVLDNPYKPIKTRKKIIIAAGWKPGWSTDYVAVLLARRFKAKEVIIASKIDYVYDRDLNHYNGAKQIKRLNWKDYRKLIGKKWIPGMGAPVDPIASKLAQELKLKVVVLRGTDLENLDNYLKGKKFEGTVIE